MSAWGRSVGWSAALAAALAVVVVVSAAIGPVRIPPAEVVMAVLNALVVPVGVETTSHGVGLLTLPSIDLAYRSPFAFPVNDVHQRIVVGVRLPRILMAALVGFALAAAGTVMQGFFRNPMADPSIIGVSSGAAVGAVTFIVFPVALSTTLTLPVVGAVDIALSYGAGVSLFAFVGALVAAFGVYAIATRHGRTPVATLLLAGVAVQTFLGAVISYLQLQAGESLRRIVAWLMGHLSGAAWSDVAVTAVVVPPLFGVLLVYARDLNVMLLGEEEAQGLGIAVERTKRILLGASALITAAGVAFAGVIGFVGLIVPHMLRLVVGPDHRVLLPSAALAGGSFLVAADTLARSGSTELPVGIVTAAVGAPFFIYLLVTREVHEL
ncbi:vitamin B12 ABC transporter permease BtuC [Halorubrum lacusprofundi]|jgi:iron complex transport system permease protein|uniref:Transport system permease protein n=1 Tax=Halorubrum lacusprofundi (strain ATCC 49239 / DSM 5036 / JCM 8891 / ACAM 34) TaxID=416348 RepID=B9LV02_HALLT|nr:vitamin B12 ABC transporter permease BtuC [Halorubrum lacusprofundi]ACM56479.1 transport system permease protein [Halorubrum lacusprofundi ATCC 49239]MCG1005249.1 vitamin B12 ABC transporter permease BtuC [Halorubrum lacusprofundi]